MHCNVFPQQKSSLKRAPQVLFAKQYYDLKCVYDDLKNIVSTGERDEARAHLAVGFASGYDYLLRQIEEKIKTVKEAVINDILMPKISFKDARNAKESFEDWENTWMNFFKTMKYFKSVDHDADIHRLETAVEYKKADRTIKQMDYNYKKFGHTNGVTFELPEMYAKQLFITDKSPTEWAEFERDRQCGILSQHEINAILRDL